MFNERETELSLGSGALVLGRRAGAGGARGGATCERCWRLAEFGALMLSGGLAAQFAAGKRSARQRGCRLGSTRVRCLRGLAPRPLEPGKEVHCLSSACERSVEKTY